MARIEPIDIDLHLDIHTQNIYNTKTFHTSSLALVRTTDQIQHLTQNTRSRAWHFQAPTLKPAAVARSP